MGGNENTVKKADNCYTSIGGLQICSAKEEPTIIKVDLTETLKKGRDKALAFKPKWAPHKPKAPGQIFGSGEDYKQNIAKKKEAPKAAPVVVAKKEAPKKADADSGIIKVDLSKTLKAGRDKALAYKPKWTPYKPKGPTAFFPDAVAYAKRPAAHRGMTTATTGMRPHKPKVVAQPSLFITPSFSMAKHPGQYELGRNFDLRNPRQLAE